MNETAAPARTAFALPLFINRLNRLSVGAMMFIGGGSLYLLSNHLHFSDPRLLPMSWVDNAVPFLPNTMWIYISEYIYFIVIYLLCKDMVNLNKYFYSFLSLQIVSAFLFWVWPTTYPRDSFPLPADLNAFTTFAFTQLRQADTPANCCPSLHVSSVYLSSFVFLDEQRRSSVLLFLGNPDRVIHSDDQAALSRRRGRGLRDGGALGTSFSTAWSNTARSKPGAPGEAVVKLLEPRERKNAKSASIPRSRRALAVMQAERLGGVVGDGREDLGARLIPR